MKAARNQSTPGKCIFCSAPHLSKEHIWPTWCHDLLVKTGIPTKGNISQHIVGRKDSVLTNHVNEKQGPIFNKRLRVVCRSCNNEWMGALEEKIKPVLTLLISGGVGTLKPFDQKMVAEWAVLKAMVVEQSKKEEEVFTAEQREEFRTSRTIPSGVFVWMGRTHSGRWLNAFLRCSAHLVYVPKQQIIRPSNTEKKNVQTTALGMGQLFLYIMVSNSASVSVPDLIDVRENLTQLWPLPASSTLLPLHRFLEVEHADQIALALNSLLERGLESGHVLYGDEYVNLM